MVFKNYLLILIFIYFNFSSIKSQTYLDVPTDEYQCIDRFVKKFNLVKTFPINNGYYTQLCSQTSTCYINGSISTVQLNGALESSINSGVSVDVSDLTCLPYITEFYVSQIPITRDLIFYQFPSVKKYSIINIQFPSEINASLPSVDSLYFSPYNYPENIPIKFSYFNNVKALQFNPLFKYPLMEMDDAAVGTKLTSMNINCGNLLNFNRYNFTSAVITLGPNANGQEIYNNYRYLNAYRVELMLVAGHPGVPFMLHTNYYISTILWSGGFLNNTQVYDLRPNRNYLSISATLSSTNPEFYYQNQIPVLFAETSNVKWSGVSNNLLSIEIPSQSLDPINKVRIYSGTNFYGNLPKYNGVVAAYGYSNNPRLSGTIDSSWCGTNLIVQNNNLTGSIPSCFTCYFSESNSNILQQGVTEIISVAMFQRFSGNSFTNYVKTTPCTTYKPQVRVYNSTAIIIYGEDIGFQLENYYINVTSKICDSTSPKSVIRLGYEYLCNVQSMWGENFLTANYLILYNIILKKSYTMALKSLKPTFTSIKTTNDNKISIVGNFFSSYLGQSNQIITIDSDIDCVMTDASFTSVVCTAPIVLSEIKKLIVLRNEDQFRKVYAVFQNNVINNKLCPNDCINNSTGGICNMYNGLCEGCPNDCSGHGVCQASTNCICDAGYTLDDCSGIRCPNDCISPLQGKCNTNNGTCTCKPGFQGTDCSIKGCPNDCSNAGVCDYKTGVCDCNDTHQGDDCSLPYKQCPIYGGQVCNNAGTCNDQIGVCTCDATHQGDDCSLPYKQCPMYSNKICGGFGSCNNQTGKCVCDDTHQGDDCSLPYKQCPIYGGQVCNNAGSCNNQTGICACDTTHQGKDCSLPYKQCPIYDGQVCNNAGTCDDQIGKCTCDITHQGDSCSLPYKQCPIYDGKVCNSTGSCNNQTGICACDTTYQGKDCSLPYKQCPIYGDQICNNAGTCNNQTGVCTCNSGRIFSNCTGYSCPNDCTSSSQGICDTSNGQCNCNSEFEGKDCSIKKCLNDCSNAGTCDNGVCICDTGRVLSDCSGYGCPKNCSNVENISLHGLCDYSSGKCSCKSDFQGLDCSIPFLQCPTSSNGILCSSFACNNVTGECDCDSGYSGAACENFEHYVTSILPSNENGEYESSFFGSFGKNHIDLSIDIDSESCLITYSSSDIINCTTPSGKGIHSVNITQNNFSFIGKNIYQYSKLATDVIDCPNNCSNNGFCNQDGTCSCYGDFSSYDCSSNNYKVSLKSTIDDNSASITFDIINTTFSFDIFSLNEVTLDNKVVNSISLNQNWIVNKESQNQYQFIQAPNNDEFIVQYTINQITTQDYSISVSVKNYKYQSVLNILQLELVSSLKDLTNTQNCNSQDAELDTNYLNNTLKNINYMKLSKNNINFVGSFMNQIISDSRSTFLPSSYSKTSNSVSLILNLPHCVNECLYELSEISVYLNSNYKDICESSSSSSSSSDQSTHSNEPSKPNVKVDNSNNWKIPVGVSVGVVGGVACLGALAYKFKDKLFRKGGPSSIKMDQRTF